MVLIHNRIIIIDICNFEMSYKSPEKSLKSNQIYSAESVLIFAQTPQVLSTSLKLIYL